jgi:hypothetical protein
VKKLFVAGVAIAAIVLSCPVRLGCRRIVVGAIASAVLALWSSGAMAACVGAATGTSAVGNTPQLFNLQCMTAIQIPGNPLQTFGASAFVRMTSTTAFYFLADRSNLGVDIIDINGASGHKFSKTLKPPAGDPVGGFIGQLIWTAGPPTDNTGRTGTADEVHSGPNGLAIPTDMAVNNGRWLYVADGGCNTDIDAASYATSSSTGSMGACGTGADSSTLPNALYAGGTNCINPGTGTVPAHCYPNQHQPNIKLFDLKSSAWVASYPTGGGCGNTGFPNAPTGQQTAPPPCVAPLGPYAPGTNTATLGRFGASAAKAVATGTTSNGDVTYLLVSTPSEQFQVGLGGATTATTCSAAFTGAATTSFPYLTLFTVNPANGTLTYAATIKVDDTSTGTLATNGSFGCDFNKKRPLNPFGSIHWDPHAGSGGAFFVALPNILNNPQINTVAGGQNGLPSGSADGRGCFYPQVGSVAPANEVDFSNNPTNGDWFWDCDGGLLMIDPVYVDKSAAQPNVMKLYPQTQGGGTVGGVVALDYCSPGLVAGGPNDGPATYDNLFLGCNPRLNGNTAGTGSAGNTGNIAETYSLALNVINTNPFSLPGPFPATDGIPPFSFANPNTNTPLPPGCVQTAGCPNPPQFPYGGPSKVQVPGGQIIGYPFTATSVLLNGATSARLNSTNFSKDPHWYVAVGGDGFSAANITTLATKTPVLAYVDALANAVIEYVPTSSGSSTLALDEQNYVVFLPVNGVVTPQLPAGDFTGNGVKLCGNGVTNLYGVLSGRGCVVAFRQQYLSKSK